MEENIVMKNKGRQANIELLRIICTLMIVFSHAAQYLYGGNWWEEYSTGFSLNFLISLLLGMWGQVSVACFVIISSYFQVDKSRIHSKKLIMLIFQTVFITFGMQCIYLIYKTQSFSIRDFLSTLHGSIKCPFNGTYWFITTYIFFYLLLPLMQFITEHISKESLKHICATLIVMVFGLAFLEKSGGGTLLEFCSLFFLVAYIKKYKEEMMKYKCKKYFIIGITLLIGSCAGLNLLSTLLEKPIFCTKMSKIFVNWNPMLILTSISLFYVFKYYVHIKSSYISKLICNLSKASIGIYILHENSIWGKNNLWFKRLHLGEKFRSSQLFFMYYIVSVFIVFAICAIIELIRLKLIDEYFFKKKMKKLDSLCDKIDHYYVCTIKS